MQIDFTKIDKSDFKCIQFGDNKNVYYGRLKWMNSETKELRDSVDDIEDEEEKAKWSRVRHGVGIQMYGKNERGVTMKYAGEWDKNQKTGDAHCVFADGSEYRGNSVNGVFQELGQFWWPADKDISRHTYKGQWSNGKMHGPGEFKHANGQSLKGTFVNNLLSVTKCGKKYFINPLDTKEEHKAFINKAIASQKYEEKKKQEQSETVNLHKAKGLAELQEVLKVVKKQGRTALLVSTSESNIRFGDLYDKLQNDGTERNLQSIYLRDLALETKDIPYDERVQYVEEKYQFGSDMLHHMITGERPGQIILNFDEKREDHDGEKALMEYGQDVSSEANAKAWTHLYDPDYELIFNPKIFPCQVLEGEKIGDFMIAKYELFDFNIKPQNIIFSKQPGPSSRVGDASVDSHTIQFTIQKKKGSLDDPMHSMSVDQGVSQNGGEINSMGSRQNSKQEDINVKTQGDLGEAFNNSQPNSQMNMSHQSPRSTLTESTKLKKQTEKLAEMKREALAKLLGLEKFQFLMWSKMKFSESESDDAILKQFHKKFDSSLPVKYLDVVLVNNI